uniref:Gamma-aminobutyric acid receptor subunit alpha-6 n=1 Tax=Macrostomum lignano TaxID=282301 RepID=A0A1I8FHA0_9PLAT
PAIIRPKLQSLALEVCPSHAFFLNGFALLLLLLALQPAHCIMYSEGVNHTEMTKNVTETLNRLLDDYDRNLRPDFGRGPIKIRINMNIRSMGPISESGLTPRLTFPAHDNFTHLQLNEKMLREIWKPDTYIVNGMGSYLHNITSPNVLFRIKNTGEILYSMRLTIKATCPMDLLKPARWRSAAMAYTDDDVIFEWSLGDQSISAQQGLAAVSVRPKSRPSHRPRGGRFSVLLCDFELHRHMGYFLIQLYFPCSLLVVLSWVGFWINREATSDRIELSTTTVLTMTFLGMDNRQDLPRVNYGTALDWYVGMCFALILATIIEFASVHYFTKVSSGECHLTLVEITGRGGDDSGDDDGEATSTATARADGGGGGGRFRYGQARPASSRRQPQSPRSVALEAADVFGGLDSQHQEQQAPADAGNGSKCGKPDGECSSKFRDSCAYAFLNCLRGSSRYKQMKLASRSPRRINQSVSRIDEVSKVLFPTLFCLFNIVYWTLYLKILAVESCWASVQQPAFFMLRLFN